MKTSMPVHRPPADPVPEPATETWDDAMEVIEEMTVEVEALTDQMVGRLPGTAGQATPLHARQP